jgi:Xaa-Pro aminopeptidase
MMEKTKLLVLGVLILSIIGCSDDIIAPPEIEYPEKLYPYETYYDAATFKKRRDDLVNNIPKDAIAVIATNDVYLRNGDVNYEFRPASNFFYLTGFDEPNAVAVIRKKDPDLYPAELILFVEKEREGGILHWLGPVYGPEGAVEYFGADEAYEFEKFGSFLSSYLNTGLYKSIYANLETNPSVADSFHNAAGDPPSIYNVNELVNELRVIKSPIEISLIQKAVDVSVQAFFEGMKTIEPAMYEYEVDALFDYVLRINGCSRTAFPTIVASGPNLNTLHYQANRRQMQNGDLVMIDYGAEYGYYAGDVTRTIPVNGKFSEKQKTIYEIVLEAHQAAINAAAPGVSYYDLYFRNRDMILDRLLEKGIVTGNKSDIISSGAYRQYIPAGLAHCVGLDVHDPFPRNEAGDRILEENMVLAFEPHIYLYEGDQTVDPAYWNIAARIEDDILITGNGSEILSKDLPMEVAEIEALMK